MDEQQAATESSERSHPEVVGDRWGDSISEGRQAELRELFERQKEWVAQQEATRKDSVFKGVRLTGADVSWLAEWSGRINGEVVPNLHLEGAHLLGAYLDGGTLAGAHLTGANLVRAHLERARLNRAQLKQAALFDAHLEQANLFGARLEGASLGGAHLERAELMKARLKGVSLDGAHLEGANLVEAQLEGASFFTVTFDKTSHLNGAVLTRASLDQVMYDGVNLTVVDWSLVPVLGDELMARQRKDSDGKPKSREQRLEEFTAAVRANRVLAVTLRSQGMNEDADRYAYRAQLLQRKVLRLRRRWGAALGSWLLDLVSGYGYKPVRSVLAYVALILFFAGLYLLNGQFAAPHLRWDEALVLSISSFHGRGFFTTGITLGDTLARLAAGEAIVGLLLEITFIATFTQRFFAR